MFKEPFILLIRYCAKKFVKLRKKGLQIVKKEYTTQHIRVRGVILLAF